MKVTVELGGCDRTRALPLLVAAQELLRQCLERMGVEAVGEQGVLEEEQYADGTARVRVWEDD